MWPTLTTTWTVAHEAPLSMGFSRQEYGSGLPFLLPGDLPNPGIELVSLASPALAGRFFTTSIAVEVQGLNHWAAREVTPPNLHSVFPSLK